MDWLAHLLTDVSSIPHIILVYSLVIAVGALLGRIRLFGVSLGVTFVLFAAIAAGHFGFTVNPAVLYFLRDFGLTVFIYFIGLQVGPSFFSSFKSGGMVLNLLTVLQVLLGVAVTIALYILFKDTLSLQPGHCLSREQMRHYHCIISVFCDIAAQLIRIQSVGKIHR